jgi:hypothetical protein
MTPSAVENVWQLEEGEIRRPGIVHIVMLALFTGIGIVVGTFGSLAIPIGFVSAFWPGQAIQAVGSIWYGMWGGIAAFVFPLISNAMSGSAPLPVSLAYIPANFVQGMASGWAFRFPEPCTALRGYVHGRHADHTGSRKGARIGRVVAIPERPGQALRDVHDPSVHPGYPTR